jgi:hypothetical protein
MWYKRKNLAGNVMVISGEVVTLCELDFTDGDDGCVNNTVSNRLDVEDIAIEDLARTYNDWGNTSLWSNTRVW